MILPRSLALMLMILWLAQPGLAQEFETKKDLSGEWLISGPQGLTPYSAGGHDVNVVYFRLSIPHPYGEYLNISGARPFTLFVNNQLAGEGRDMVLDLDSLSKSFASRSLLIAVFQEGLQQETLNTLMLSERLVGREDESPGTRPSYFLRDFGILAALLLTVMVVVIVRLNPKLAGDYFSPLKIFSLREDEAQMGTRMASSTNILFYVYCSLLLGYYFSVIFHFLPEEYTVGLAFRSETFWGAMAQWIKLSSIILLFLVVKIILILNLSYLFGITDIGGLHFLNWVRLIVVFFGVLTLAMFIYFVSHGYDANTHVLFLKLVVWATGLWIVLLFLKLSSKVSASMFHLFSYICATELIPFLLIVKVLYN